MKIFQRLTPYNPKNYWSKRFNPNNKQGESEEFVERHVKFIRKHLGNCDKVFELGPGVGRTFACYKPNTRVFALDITDSFASRLLEKANEYSINLECSYLNEPTQSFPYNSNQFVVGVTSQCLLHVPPSTIRHYLNECMRICQKLIVISMFEQLGKAQYGNYVFNHDYLSLFSEMGLSLDDVSTHERQIFFTVRKS